MRPRLQLQRAWLPQQRPERAASPSRTRTTAGLAAAVEAQVPGVPDELAHPGADLQQHGWVDRSSTLASGPEGSREALIVRSAALAYRHDGRPCRSRPGVRLLSGTPGRRNDWRVLAPTRWSPRRGCSRESDDRERQQPTGRPVAGAPRGLVIGHPGGVWPDPGPLGPRGFCSAGTDRSTSSTTRRSCP